ncbi:MAG: T9SS type A sorting domain-containing protein [Bacteroidetes bacterium]|nr:T9SS type A sorting domain-containing protein [Bacteroidota bacterium]
MKNIFTKTKQLLGAVLLLSSSAFAQITWDFGTTGNLSAYPSAGIPANVTVDSLTRGNSLGTAVLLSTTSASNTYPGFSAGGNAGVPARIGALDYTVNGTTGSAYFEVKLTPDAGYTLNITNIEFGSRSTGTGPRKYSIRTSLDSYMTEQAGDTINSAASAWGLRTEALSITGTPGTAITLRIYGYDGAGSPTPGTVNFRIDDLKITATATLATPQIVFEPVNANVCSGATAQFATFTPGTFTYQWQENTGSGFVSLTNTGVYTGADDDTLNISNTTGMNGYTYRCIVTNGSGNDTSNVALLTVSAPVVPTVSIPTSMTSLCAGDAATISATATNEGTAPTYEWFWVGFGSVGTGQTLNVPAGFLPAGTHTIYCELTSNAACAAPTLVTSNSLTVTVDPLPATPVISQEADTLSTTQYASYQWYLDGTTMLGTDSAQTASTTGAYTVVVTNVEGCSATSAAYNYVVTSIGSNQATAVLTIYPNPSNGIITITTNNAIDATVFVYNVLGKLIATKQLNGISSNTIDLSAQANGSYFVVFKTDKETITKKITITK